MLPPLKKPPDGEDSMKSALNAREDELILSDIEDTDDSHISTSVPEVRENDTPFFMRFSTNNWM